MQFGSSRRVQKLAYVLLFTGFSAGALSAQFGQLGQTIDPSSQSSSCDANDPTCQNGGNLGNRGAYSSQIQGSQSSTNSQGINLQSGQQGSQSNTSNTDRNSQRNQSLNLPPDPPSEFQQMVASTTGKMLPIYGAKLFRNAPSTFAPLDLVPVTPDYVIGPGDELLLQIWGQVTLNGRFTVDRSGNVYVPQVGTFRVAGLKFDQLQEFLKSQIGKTFRNFDLNVNMGQLRSIQVFVVGQVRRPGSYTLSSLSSLVNAIFATGGPTPQGSMRHIQLKRSGSVVVDFDLYDLLQRGDKSKDVQLLPGDILYFPPVGPQVAVAGSVNTPAIYEMRSTEEATIGNVLDLAAGLTNVAADGKIRLERVDEHHLRSMAEVQLDVQGRSTQLRDGDILELTAVIDRYKDAVTLRGNVANPGRYAWKPGMRVHDLFPDKDSLITRDYWLKRGMLGQPVLTYIPTCVRTTPYGVPITRYDFRYGAGTGIGIDTQNSTPSLTPFNGNTNQTGTPNGTSNTPIRSDGSTNNQAILDNGTVNPNQNEIGTDCSSITEDGQNQVYPPYQTGSSNLQGNGVNGQTPTSLQGNNQLTPGGTQQNTAGSNRSSSADAIISASSSQFRPRNDVKLREPDIDWSYAVIERQSKETLTTSLIPFNLGKLVLQDDATQNIELEPSDVVTIFSKADLHVPQTQQTRFVRLEGEFNSSGIYSVQPGETLRQLVQRAGGFSPDAYLYGSEFTRESTRRVQQQRLNEYIDQVELQASTNASNNASRAISAVDSAAAAAQVTQNQAIIASLRHAQSTGRVVLDLAPDSNSVAQLPDLPLEDGDRFIVPRVPSTVSVDGAVYNQNAFLYDPSHRLRDYVRLAGGSNRDADKKRAYVIRADGSVVSKQYSSTLRGSGFDSVRLNPGDTIVIPLNLSKGASLRTIVDIAQIAGSLGLAVGALNAVF
jgi:protein involved in polysaccharide export with SLBB domain